MPKTLLLIVLLAATLSGCNSDRNGDFVLRLNPNSWGDAQVTDRSAVFEATEAVAVDVETFQGNITLDVHPKYEFIQVTVTRKASLGNGRLDEADASLDDIDYSIDLIPGDLGRTLQVRTWSAHPEPHFQSTDLSIRMPAAHNVRMATTNGEVIAEGISGTVDLETTKGNVRVISFEPMTDAVRILNRDGNIDYRVRGDSSGMFKCQSFGGEVSSVVKFGKWRTYSGTDDDTLIGQLNDGDNIVDLRTVFGNIEVAVVGDPYAVGRSVLVR